MIKSQLTLCIRMDILLLVIVIDDQTPWTNFPTTTNIVFRLAEGVSGLYGLFSSGVLFTFR